MMQLKPQGWRRLLLVSMVWGLLAGCRSVEPVEAPVARAVSVGHPVGAEPEAPATRVVQVVLDHGAGMVVVNRRPLGLAPQGVELPVTALGYLADPVAITVRFVAGDASEASFTIEEVLEVTDRPPSTLIFSRDGVRRVFEASP